MNNETHSHSENPVVEVMPDNSTLTSPTEKTTTDPVRDETIDLFNAIRSKAQWEAQKAGEFARDVYLDAVRRAKTEVENLELFDPKPIENAFEQVQDEVEKDWDEMVKQVAEVGDRLNEAAKAAWEKLTAPSSK